MYETGWTSAVRINATLERNGNVQRVVFYIM